MKEAHGINVMGDCQTAMSVEEFKEKNPWFIQNISEAEITRDEIAKAEAHAKTESGNVVYIEEYTRADGVHVKGHYRRIS